MPNTTTYTTNNGITYRDKIDAYFMALMSDPNEAAKIREEITQEWVSKGLTDLSMVSHNLKVAFVNRGYGKIDL